MINLATPAQKPMSLPVGAGGGETFLRNEA